MKRLSDYVWDGIGCLLIAIVWGALSFALSFVIWFIMNKISGVP